jgi:hypothetical protein
MNSSDYWLEVLYEDPVLLLPLAEESLKPNPLKQHHG